MKNTTMKIAVALCAALLAWNAQAQSPKAFENAANDAFRSKDYYSAMQYYGKVLEMEPTRLDLSYRYADAARQSGAFGQAEAWFEKTIQGDQLREFPDAELRLASVKKNLGKYDEAIRLFEKYEIDPQSTESTPLRKQAQEDAMQCEWAMEKMKNPDRSVEIEQLSDLFNTPQPDFGTAVFDGKIYYSSFRDTKWGDRHYPSRSISKIMEASPEGGDPTLAPFNVDKRHTAHAAFSPEGNFVIFNQCDYVGDIDVVCELYFSEKTSTGWSKPIALPENINVKGFTSTQPSVAPTADGYYLLYYASNKPGGKGGLDLWQARFSATGTFDKPENLRELNTTENDITPNFDSKRNVLYYSTRGQWTLGGYDIYKVEWKEGKWQEPAHLDVPYNSSFDDVYFVPTSDEFAYLTSNRKGSKRLDEVCCYDIFKVEYLPLSLEALAFSKVGYRPLDNVVFSLEEVVEEGEKPAIVTHFSGEENSTGFDIMRQRNYRIIATKEFYRPDTVYVSTSTFPPDRRFIERLYLVPEVNLAVKTFHEWTKEPLASVHIRLLEITGKQFGAKDTGKDGNEAKLDVSDKRWFTIIAEKEDFAPDTAIVTVDELKALIAGETLTKHLFLTPASMSSYLPIALFFDNDQPDPRTYAKTTKLSYEQTVDRYVARRAAFIETYTANLQGIEKEEAVARLGKFFDEDVMGGQAKLEDFASNLTLFLGGGATLDIMVKAFASPLAKPEYNMALTQRRIASVRNYFRRYGNGIFEQYIRNGQLKVSMLPLGETAADPNVSDDAKNKRLSVFSPEASRERRAEILEVRIFRD